jgi:SAM-dependent methyltransferase
MRDGIVPAATGARIDLALREAFARSALSAARSAGLSLERARTVLAALDPRAGLADSIAVAVRALEPDPDPIAPEALGPRYESLLARVDPRGRKRGGSYFTPPHLARALCERALGGRPAGDVLDPACGAGAVLLEALRWVPAERVHGADVDLVAVWVARVALALVSGAHHDEAILGWSARVRARDALAPEPFGPAFDAVVGNPPWVAYAGRSAEPIEPAVRAEWKRRFESFQGFPTAHGMFIERAASLLAPGGRLALLVPVPVADLDGYRATRAALARYAVVDQPLEELDPDAFEGVVQPAMILAATAHPRAATNLESMGKYSLRPVSERPSRGRRSARDDALPLFSAPARSPAPSSGFAPSPAPAFASAPVSAPVSSRSDRWLLARPGATEPPRVLAPSLMERLAELPRFAPETFGEGGFQSAGTLAAHNLGPWPGEPRFSVPLREGADVEAFACRPPSLALDPDPAALARARATLRPAAFYARVPVLIRQTARFPIASRNEPAHGFRNSLLAGFSEDPDALCALLNSALLRAWHLCSQRDGRQAVFPQLKVAHLRALPAPPAGASLADLSALARVAASSQRARIALAKRFIDDQRALGARVPRGALDPRGDQIPGSPPYAQTLRDPETLARYEETLARSRALWASTRETFVAIDEAVFALYGLTELERASVRAALAPSPSP